jgi:alkylation response protein AidB-like acyl-CoA dehydrogenase
MDFAFSADDERFRGEVRHFFEHEYPPDLIEKIERGEQLGKRDLQRSEQAYAAKGWLAVDWPVEHGGTGWSPTQKYIFDEELERAGAMNVTPFGLLYVGPVIYTFGNAEQQERWLPDIRESRVLWAQGYSEPEAGSDLASLRCRADRDGDEYVVNGTKTWTSLGQHADWLFCLVRTDDSGKKQQGITFLCLEMSTPGITLHPIIGIDGYHSLNTVEFSDVRVPVANRIGEEGQAWAYSKYLLANERTSYAHIGGKRVALDRLREAVGTMGPSGGSLLDDPLFAARLAQVEINFRALEVTVLRALSSLAEGAAPGAESSAIKILATENSQAITELYIEAAGHYGVAWQPDHDAPPWTSNQLRNFGAIAIRRYLGTRAESIYGGTNEIQRNVISQRVLGL